MKITLESTTKIVNVTLAAAPLHSIACRVWEGQTESGIKVSALIPRIAALATDDLSQFEAELEEQAQPTEASRAFPLRMVI